MTTDSAYMIGTTHSVCQDYAFAKHDFVIVSDGCSTSPDTDIGSRLLARAACELFSQLNGHEMADLHERSAGQALHWAREIGLPPQAVDATLLTALYRNGELTIGASGDGVVVLESHSGMIDSFSITFPSGYPLYLAYAHQPERLLAWQSNHDAQKEIRHFQAMTIDSHFELIGTSTSSSMTETMQFSAHEYKYVALISDGVHSFYKTENGTTSLHMTSIPMIEVVNQLIAFKGGKGAFVGRRAKKFARQCEAAGWRHTDDLAVGAMYLVS